MVLYSDKMTPNMIDGTNPINFNINLFQAHGHVSCSRTPATNTARELEALTLHLCRLTTHGQLHAYTEHNLDQKPTNRKFTEPASFNA